MSRVIACLIVAAGLVGAFIVAPMAEAAELQSIERASLRPNSSERDGADISPDGQYVAFVSESADLVPDVRHTEATHDVFLSDVDSGTLVRVSVNQSGADANERSTAPSVSEDGRFVAFQSWASDLVADDGNIHSDIFVRDMQFGVTTRISLNVDGNDANAGSSEPAITPDGRYVAFTSTASDLVEDDGNGQNDVFVHDIQTGSTILATVAFDGGESDNFSGRPAISSDGRYVAFQSMASNLVADDQNGMGQDVFVRDLVAGTTELVSVDHLAEGSDGQSNFPAISADGHLVAFSSDATNLIADDTNGQSDIFVRDLDTDVTERVSLTFTGAESNGSNTRPWLSSDGRYVSFDSRGNNMLPSGARGIVVRDRVTATNVLANTTDDDVPSASVASDSSLSDDGRYVAFDSSSATLTVEIGATDEDVFRKDLITGDIVMVSPTLGRTIGYRESGTPATNPSISADGRLVAYTSWDTGVSTSPGVQAEEVWLRDRDLGTTTELSVSPTGSFVNGSSWGVALSGDGAFAAFISEASDLVPGFDPGGASQVFSRDIVSGTTSPVSVNLSGQPGDGFSQQASISADGRYVAFASDATDLVADDGNGISDVFVRDQVAGTTTRVSIDIGGTDPDGLSYQPAISADGRYVAFSSDATDLVMNDGNGTTDVFVADLQAGTIARVSVDVADLDSDGYSYTPSISGDGQRVAFVSTATNLVAGAPSSGYGDVYVRDLDSGVTELISVAVSGGADSLSHNPSISADGLIVAFESWATNLTAEGVIGLNVYARDLSQNETTRVSVPMGGASTENSDDGFPSVNADGTFVAFGSTDSMLVPKDTNGIFDIFVAELTLEQPVPQCLGNPATVVGAGSISGTAGADVIVGSDGPDVINGLGGDDIVCGLGDNDQISGDAGADLMAGGAGDDTLTGGGSLDTVTYESSTSGVDVDLTAGTGSGDGTDTLASVESIRGSSHDDVIWGSGAANTLEGREGADELVGRGGNDIMLGGPGDDEISGMAGDDSLDGGEANDLCVQGTGAGTPVACEISAIPVTLGDASALEPDTGTTPAVFTVSIPIPTDTPITMTASTQDGSALGGVDYTARTGVAVTIPGGQTSREVNVQVRGDYTPEPNESFTLLLSGVVGGSLADGSGTATIEDEDPPESLPLVSIGDVEVIESNRATYTVQLAVSLSAPFPAPVTVDFTTVPGGTATAGLDYNEAAPTQVRFAPGVTERVARITLRGDSEIEPNETVRVALSNLVNANLGDGEADITLVDDDTVPTLSVTPVSVIEGTGGPTTAVFTFELDRPFGAQARVRYATADGTALAPGDYTQVGNTILRFDPGVISQQVVIQVNGDTEIEMDETFTLNLSNLVNLVSPGSSVQGTILNDD